MGLGALAVAAASIPVGADLILINTTPSEPPGLYIRSALAPTAGRLVAFRPPAQAALVGDGHLARLRSFLKAVVAVSGDEVCSDGDVAKVDGAVVGAVAKTDRSGRPLPRWRGCRRLVDGEVFVVSDRVSNSFDSRYFGPVPQSAIIGVYRPLWVWR